MSLWCVFGSRWSWCPIIHFSRYDINLTTFERVWSDYFCCKSAGQCICTSRSWKPSNYTHWIYRVRPEYSAAALNPDESHYATMCVSTESQHCVDTSWPGIITVFYVLCSSFFINFLLFFSFSAVLCVCVVFLWATFAWNKVFIHSFLSSTGLVVEKNVFMRMPLRELTMTV